MPPSPDTIRPTSGSEQFLWKPKRHNGPQLIVLLPYWIALIDIDRVEIQMGSTVIEKAHNMSWEEGVNGNRVHCRYTKPGGAYGNGLALMAYLEDGRVYGWAILHGADRVEKYSPDYAKE
jgi:hypothetical protein